LGVHWSNQWLTCHGVNGAIAISKKALDKAMEKVKELTPRGTRFSLEQTMETINKWY
jgi:RNA-directed DNA polymerase